MVNNGAPTVKLLITDITLPKARGDDSGLVLTSLGTGT